MLRRAAGGLLVPALLLLVATARAQGDGSVPCGGGGLRCAANEWCDAASHECRDCYGCAVGMECLARLGCRNCTAGTIDHDTGPTTLCEACPDGRTAAAGATECAENPTAWVAEVEGLPDWAVEALAVVGGLLLSWCGALLLPCRKRAGATEEEEHEADPLMPGGDASERPDVEEGGAALVAGLSRASSLGSVDSFVMLKKSVARCRACLKLDIAAYPDDSTAQAEFKQAFIKEMTRVLGHLLVQNLDAEGSDRVQAMLEQLQRCARALFRMLRPYRRVRNACRRLRGACAPEDRRALRRN